MGLFDGIDFGADQNRLGMALLAAAGPSIEPKSFGQRLFAGMSAHDKYLSDKEEREQIRKQREAQAQFQQMQMMQMIQAQAERKAQQEKAAAIEGAYRGAIRSPDQQAMGQFGGPTVAAAQAAPGMTPQIDQRALIESLAKVDPMTAFQMMQPKKDDYKVVGDALVSVGPGGVKEAYRAPAKPEKQNWNDLVIMGPDGVPVINKVALDARRQVAEAGRTSVNVPVNLGQKGLDNTLKLRGDFRSEPIYKAHQDVLSAHSQITSALKQASPAGDLAGATKLMKILDPGSVVRESELGMAMSASGLADRLANYAKMVVTGQKLTPTQRIDFQTLADSLTKESERLYNAKRNEYAGIVKRNQLNEDDVLGPAPSSKWSIERVQ